MVDFDNTVFKVAGSEFLISRLEMFSENVIEFSEDIELFLECFDEFGGFVKDFQKVSFLFILDYPE